MTRGGPSSLSHYQVCISALVNGDGYEPHAAILEVWGLNPMDASPRCYFVSKDTLCSLQPYSRKIEKKLVQKIHFNLAAGAIEVRGLQLHTAARCCSLKLQLEGTERMRR